MTSSSGGASLAESPTSPSTTFPVVPSSEMTSPSDTVVSPTVKAVPLMRRASAPTTAGMPQPRATTAAWLTNPPRAVRMPWEACMPCTSSGEVSLRTRITFSPRAAASAAASAVKYALPTAAPGDAARPEAITCTSADANWGWRTCSTWSSLMRSSASSREIDQPCLRPCFVISTAMRSAARPVRLPTRVCSIQSLPRSMVNSVSHMSR